MTLADPGNTFFPYNILETLQSCLTTIDPDLTFFQRRVLPNDPDQTIGLCPIDWEPGTKEIGRVGPSTQSYTIYIQTLIVDPYEERGLRVHSFFSKRVREMLAHYQPLRILLENLETTDPYGQKEKTVSFELGNQAFHNQELDGNWRWLSTLDFKLDTQIR